MTQTSTLRITLLSLLLLLGVSAFSAPVAKADSLAKTTANTVVVSAARKVGDKLFSKLKFDKAIKAYTRALSTDGDTVYVIQRIAESYKIKGDARSAESWYARIANNPKMSADSKFNYAEVLRNNKNYTAAQKYYEAYLQANPKATGIRQSLAEWKNLGELTKDNPAYRVEISSISTAKADYAPMFYKDGQLLFTSNRKNKKAVFDKWSADQFSRIYLASMDSTQRVTAIGSKAKRKIATGSVAYNKQNDELIFSRSSFKKKALVAQNGKKVPAMQLYSSVFNGKSAGSQVALPINVAGYSTGTPAFSKDGKTMYFASDRPGGLGGTDLYYSTRDANGKWSEPKSLGANINTAFDEKYPFVAEDGTLYFASNNPGGLGGLDVYKAKLENNSFSAAENVGAPVNSSKDDYGFIMAPDNKGGYFTSNRDGGMGEDDIYKFTFDITKLEYKVTVKVVESLHQNPLPLATLALDCKGMNPENTLADENGEKQFTIKGGKICSLDIIADGYKPGNLAITPADRGKTVTVTLNPDIIKWQVTVLQKENMQPVRDAAITIINGDGAEMNYVTDENGKFEATLPAAKYKVSSHDYSSVQDQFTQADADKNSLVLARQYLIPRNELAVNVPLTANCFSSAVSVTDLGNGQTYDVKPNTNGVLRIDLKLDNIYLIKHNQRVDTISTYDLHPGQEIEGPCKFFVGQTWIVNNIYYDFNKWNIRADAATELDNVVRLMKENPTLEIELGSHTDCRGPAQLNNVISARRAKSVVDYLGAKGIKKKRIIAAGYGELHPTNNCVCEGDQKSDCTEEQHQKNRRTEVKVLKY